MKKALSVLILDDSVIFRSQIKLALSKLNWIESIKSVPNGKVGIEWLKQSEVDLIILDIEMPEMDGLQMLRVLAENKIKSKVLIFSSYSKADAKKTVEALSLGAADCVEKPKLTNFENTEGSLNKNLSLKNIKAEPSDLILSTLEPRIKSLFPRFMNKADNNQKLSQNEIRTDGTSNTITARKSKQIKLSSIEPEIVVIGSSTGGPTTLEFIFKEFHSTLNCPIVIVQHMPPMFTTFFAERMQKISGIPTHEASDGMLLQPNHIYIAPGDYHMTLRGDKTNTEISLNQGPHINSVRPAVDPLFESAAEIFKNKCLGIILTGMGSDGKLGAQKIMELNGHVFIQSEETCVVFGMPGAVMSVGAYDLQLSPEQISGVLREKVIPPSFYA